MRLKNTPLEFAGDNPCVVLYDENGQVSSAISYWNSNASLAGAGQLMFLITTEGGKQVGRIFTDNTDLVEFCVSFNQHFLGFESIDWKVEAIKVEAIKAKLEMVRKDDRYTLNCSHGGGTITATWGDLEPPYINRAMNTDFGNEVGRSYDVSCVIISAGSGSIEVDGKALAGAVSAPYGGLPRSAFLAFCETWSRRPGAVK